MTQLIGAAALAAFGVAVLVACSYLLLLAVAALRPRADGRAPMPGTGPRLAVLVPAHDEEQLIQRCLRSLADQTYPAASYEVVVIADNCTDRTAELAAAAGARVLVRDAPDDRGKGQALRWAMDQLLSEPTPPDGLAVVDADSVAEPGLLAALASRLANGADAVQAEYLVLPEGDGTGATLREAAILLFHRVRFSGRDRLGWPCNLVGNGMLFSRQLLLAHPWTAFSQAEDLEYSIQLRLAGIGPVFAADGCVRGPMPTDGRAARTQRERWEGGRIRVVRASLPKLIRATLRHPRRGPADAAVDLAIPPLGLLALLAVGGSIVSAAAALVGLAAWWAVIPWLGSVLALALFVLVGLRAARAPAATYRALLRAPWFLITRLTGLVGVLRRSRNTDWVRTERLVDTTGAAERVLIDGVPIDWVDTDTAIERLVTAAHTDGFMQVSTVNLDFLVNARRSPDIRAILDGNGLNLADGAPVVWLGRLRGVRGPERVAGSDLVPRLMKVAADQGLGVFFLGGEHGASEEAARCLRVSYPDLQVEVYEPPRGGLDSLSDPEIFRRIDASGARLLLVAFGHPKQERWIRQHRDQLRMVAVGVGCSLDLIAGRSKRAPAWMQRVGLEWCYRLFREPGRLLRRYATDGLWFLGVLLPSTMRDRIKRRPLVHLPAASPVTAVEPSDAWSDPPAATELSQTA